MVLILGSLELGMIYGLLALGIFITFRILNIPDLTCEGSFTLGLSLSAALTRVGHPFLGMIAGIIGGMAAGGVTGFLQTRCNTPDFGGNTRNERTLSDKSFNTGRQSESGDYEQRHDIQIRRSVFGE